MIVSIEQLFQLDSCNHQMILFQKIFSSKEIEFNKENIKKAIDGGLNIIWWLRVLIKSNNNSVESKFYQNTIDLLWQPKENQNPDVLADHIYKSVILNISLYHNNLKKAKEFSIKKQNGEIPIYQMFWKVNK